MCGGSDERRFNRTPTERASSGDLVSGWNHHVFDLYGATIWMRERGDQDEKL
jgi:hypothetical protein